MRKLDVFRVTKNPYAIDLTRFKSTVGTRSYRGEAAAIWFRRSKGYLHASIGTLSGWTDLDEGLGHLEPESILGWASRCPDPCGTARTRVRENGEVWTQQPDFEQMQQDVAVLKRALAGFPEVPEGYDGWWTVGREPRS